MALQFQDERKEAWRLLPAAPQPEGNQHNRCFRGIVVLFQHWLLGFESLEGHCSLLCREFRRDGGKLRKKKKKKSLRNKRSSSSKLTGSAWHVISVWILKLNHFSSCTVRIWGRIRL